MLEHGYTIPASSTRQENQLNEKLNSVYHFIKTSPRVVVGRERHNGRPSPVSEFGKVYTEYLHFCVNTALVKPVTSTMFRERMQSLQKSFGFQEVMQENIRGGSDPRVRIPHVCGKAGGVSVLLSWWEPRQEELDRKDEIDI